MDTRHQHHVPPSLVGWLLARGLNNRSANGMGRIVLTFIIKTARDFLSIGMVEGAVA